MFASGNGRPRGSAAGVRTAQAVPVRASEGRDGGSGTRTSSSEAPNVANDNCAGDVTDERIAGSRKLMETERHFSAGLYGLSAFVGVRQKAALTESPADIKRASIQRADVENDIGVEGNVDLNKPSAP